MNTHRSQTSKKQILCKHTFIGKMRFIIFIVGKRKLHKIHRKLCKNLSLPSSDVYHRYLSDGKYSFDKYSLLLVAKIFFLAAVTIKNVL